MDNTEEPLTEAEAATVLSALGETLNWLPSTEPEGGWFADYDGDRYCVCYRLSTVYAHDPIPWCAIIVYQGATGGDIEEPADLPFARAEDARAHCYQRAQEGIWF